MSNITDIVKIKELVESMKGDIIRLLLSYTTVLGTPALYFLFCLPFYYTAFKKNQHVYKEVRNLFYDTDGFEQSISYYRVHSAH